jgi:hypothetical protein
MKNFRFLISLVLLNSRLICIKNLFYKKRPTVLVVKTFFDFYPTCRRHDRQYLQRRVTPACGLHLVIHILTMNGSMDFSPLSSSPSVTTGAAFLTPREQFTMTKGGIILTIITGTLSAVCSVLFLNVIRMSNQKLSTTYHRVMVLMSIFDIMASLCMALTTLPMPSDDELRFDGLMLGNKVTCQIQGYFAILGTISGASLYMCLSWYFVFKMTFKLSSERISKIIEPVFMLYSVGTGLVDATVTLSRDLIHSIPRTSFCFIAPVHVGCERYTIDEEFFVCEPDEFQKFHLQVNDSNYLMIFNIVMTIFAVLIIIWTVFRDKKRHSLADDHSNGNVGHISDDGEAQDDLNTSAEMIHSRVLITQALMYVFAYLITYSFRILPFILTLGKSEIDILMIFKSIFFPMQGFWNLIIFLYDKAYLVRHSGVEKKGYYEAFKTILFYPADALEISIPVSLMNDDRNYHVGPHEISDDQQEEPPDLAIKMPSYEIAVIDPKVNIDTYGIRRAAQFKLDTPDNNDGAVNSSSNLSISTPGGFVSHSVESSFRSTAESMNR